MTDPIALLRESALFSHFDDDAIRAVASRCTTRSFAKDDTLWTVGDRADELFVIAEGEVAVWGSDEIVARLTRGATVGEVALLLHEPRSATVTATRATRVLVLDGDSFDTLVRPDARAVVAVSEILSRRLRATTQRARARGTLVCAVVAEPGQHGVTLVGRFVAARLARDLGHRVLRLVVGDHGPSVSTAARAHDWASMVERDTLQVRAEASAVHTVDAVTRLAERVSARHAAVVIEVSRRAGLDAVAAGAFAGVVVELGRDTHARVPNGLHTRRLRVRNHADGTVASHVTAGPLSVSVPYDAELAGCSMDDAVDLLLNDPQRPTARALDRLVRAIERRVVGVALSAGAALGLAHVGVLRELDAKGVPVDVVAGSSMGAVIGAGYAAGATGSDLEVYAERAASLLRLVRAFDVAFTGDGILAGRQLLDYFRPFLHGARRFDELVLPARIVATDLSHGRTVAIGEGDLEAALRASIAMPPFLTPVLRDGQTLVDGGIVDPLPVDVVRDLGADIVIAVHAIPALDADAATLLTRVSRTLNRVNPVAWLAGRSRSLNLIDLVMNSFHLVEHQLGAHLARGAEVVVEPDLSGHTWIEFYRAHELIERGASAARRAIPDIETVLAQRLAATRPGTGAATPA